MKNFGVYLRTTFHKKKPAGAYLENYARYTLPAWAVLVSYVVLAVYQVSGRSVQKWRIHFFFIARVLYDKENIYNIKRTFVPRTNARSFPDLSYLGFDTVAMDKRLLPVKKHTSIQTR